MNIIGFKIIASFTKLHPDAESSLKAWHKIVRTAVWNNIVEVKQTYPHADAAGTCTVFNLRGNHYRLIVIIDYRAQTIYIRNVLTHAEYDKEKWKKDCGRQN